MTLDAALESLRRGEFVLLHDSRGRENEVDMVVAAELASPQCIARMRQHAGGLLCLALDGGFAGQLGLRYMHDMLPGSIGGDLEPMIAGRAPYGDRPTFSISVNHRQTYTGITDSDRALTIQEVSKLYGRDRARSEFASSFSTPGHVPLLIASSGLLAERQGHTEMSVYLCKMAGLRPAAAICEMMDAQTYSALSVEKAAKYAGHNGIALLDGAELLEHARVRPA